MKVIIYGAGFWGEIAFRHFGAENVYCFCDIKQKDGKAMLCGKKVISFSKLQEIWKDYVIVISAGVNFNVEISRMSCTLEQSLLHYLVEIQNYSKT